MDEVVFLSVLSAALNSHWGASHSLLRGCGSTVLAKKQAAIGRLAKDEKLKKSKCQTLRRSAIRDDRFVLRLFVLGEWELTDRTTSRYWDLQGEKA